MFEKVKQLFVIIMLYWMVIPELLRLDTPPLWPNLSGEVSDPSVFFFILVVEEVAGLSNLAKACFVSPVCLRNLS